MKKAPFLVLIALLLGTNAAPAQTSVNPSGSDLVPDRILVTLREGIAVHRDKAVDPVGVGVASLDALAGRFAVHGMDPLYGGMTVKLPNAADRAALDRVWAVDFPATAGLERVLAAYAALPEVEKVEPVGYLRSTQAYLPDDPALASDQWYLRNSNLGGGDVRAIGGWNQTLGDSNVVIAVVDSGVDWHHPDLGGDHPDKVTGAIWTNWEEYYGSPGVDDDNNGKFDDIRGWDFVNVNPASVWPGEDATVPDNDPMDFGGHGTQVAGCAAAITDNGVGIAGTAPGCKIMALRAGYLNSAGDGVLRTDWISSAIIYAAANGADIINCSWTSSSLISSAVNAAQNSGLLLVSAAGNENTDSSAEHWLSSVPGVLTVAATGSADSKTSFSNYGTWVDLAAPGEGIYTTAYNRETGDHIYGLTQGTSFSAPIVSGLAALVWSAHPGWNYTQVGDLLKDSCDNIDAQNPGYAGLLGAGRANILKALGDDRHLYPAEFPTLYDALNSAAAEDTIAIEGGAVVTGPLTVPGKAIKIFGGYDASYSTRDPVGSPVVVQGNVGSHALRFQGDATPATVLDGFRIQGGGGQTLSGIPFNGRYGGGVMLNGVSPTLRNFEITGNSVGNSSTLGMGGGIAMHGASPVLENVRVHGNTALFGAGIFMNDSSPTLIDCVIEDNILIGDNLTAAPRGGGLYLVDTTADLTDCDVRGHAELDQGGGIYAEGDDTASVLVMTRGSVTGNTAVNGGAGIFIAGGEIRLTSVTIADNVRSTAATFMYGGGIHAVGATAIIDSLRASGNDAHIGGAVHLQDAASAEVTNSVLHGNTAQLWGGGLHLSNMAGGTIRNNTVAANDATLSGAGGMYLGNSPVDLANNIVAFNTGGASFANGVAYSGAAGAVTCNDVFGNAGGDYSGIADPTGTAGNISADPLFCDLATGKLNVDSGSPCAPAGSGGCGLIGALPGGCGVSPVPVRDELPVAFRVDQNYPNPFNPRTTIRFELPRAADTRVTIFDVAGRHVKTLVDEELAARTHEVTWTGDDENGRNVAAGVYFYLVTSGKERSVGRMALVK